MSWILNCRWDVFFHDKFYLSRGVPTRKKHLLLSNILIEWNFNSCFTLMVWILKLMRYFRFVGVSLPPVKQRWAFGGAGVALRALCLELHSLGLAVPIVLVDQALPFCAPVLSPVSQRAPPACGTAGKIQEVFGCCLVLVGSTQAVQPREKWLCKGSCREALGCQISTKFSSSLICCFCLHLYSKPADFAWWTPNFCNWPEFHDCVQGQTVSV